jgi:hypothetical protein
MLATQFLNFYNKTITTIQQKAPTIAEKLTKI